MRDKFMNDLERVYQEVFEESSSKDKLDYGNKNRIGHCLILKTHLKKSKENINHYHVLCK